jgi:hypothetical protein
MTFVCGFIWGACAAPQDPHGTMMKVASPILSQHKINYAVVVAEDDCHGSY